MWTLRLDFQTVCTYAPNNSLLFLRSEKDILLAKNCMVKAGGYVDGHVVGVQVIKNQEQVNQNQFDSSGWNKILSLQNFIKNQ